MRQFSDTTLMALRALETPSAAPIVPPEAHALMRSADAAPSALNLGNPPAKNAKKRNFAAAQGGRLTRGWSTVPTPHAFNIQMALQQLRARSREQSRNNDYARRFIAMSKINIIGPKGVAMQARTIDLNGEQDTLANDTIETGWKIWSRRECDAGGRLPLTDMCRLIIGTVAIDGECLVRQISAGAYGFQLKLIDPELLDIRLNQKLSDNRTIRMGVEMDSHGKALAYHLHSAPDDTYQSSYNTGGKHIRVPAAEILHLYLPENIDQVRGVPWMASALVRMKNLNGYEEAAVVAARVGASKMGFFHTKDGEAPDVLADEEGTDAEEGDFIQESSPGTFDVLPEGYDFTAFNPDYPHQQFGEFIKATLRGVASGIGVSYNALANDLEGVNFSSIRAGVLEEREQWKTLQNWFIEAFMRPVYESWLNTQLAIGSLRVPSKTGPKPLSADRFEKYKNVTFQARRWAWVDPLKDMKANELALALNLKSRSSIIREMDDGGDPEEIWREIERENKQMEKLGVAMNADTATAADIEALIEQKVQEAIELTAEETANA